MQILYGFFRVKPENIGFATCMKNIGLRFASSNIFHTCSSSNIFRYHPQAIQYCIKLGMWVVGAQVLPTWSVITKCAYLIPHLHICSDWLITKKPHIQSSVWATLMKLDMFVVMGTSTTCRHQMHIFNTLFAYLF